MSKIPKHILEIEGLTSRQWKAQKRRQMQAVLKALDDFRSGCVYTPFFSEGDAAFNLLERWSKAMSVKNWGR